MDGLMAGFNPTTSKVTLGLYRSLNLNTCLRFLSLAVPLLFDSGSVPARVTVQAYEIA